LDRGRSVFVRAAKKHLAFAEPPSDALGEASPEATLKESLCPICRLRKEILGNPDEGERDSGMIPNGIPG
jgi:hypothetical protein